jgi:hypothetical protein
MTTLRDLVFRVEEADVSEVIGRLYDRRETPWLPEAVADVLTELRRLTPDASGAEYQLDIELLPPIDPDDEPYWDVCCRKEGYPERYGLDLSRWEEWLAVRVPRSLLAKMTAAEIVAHCLWEMTFYGFTQEKIAAFRAELESNVKEIDAGKPELVSWEQVKGEQEYPPFLFSCFPN